MIIFLDIDGVLHPEPATAEQAFCRRHLLWEMLSARPRLQLVISSDWREHHSLPELTGLITSGGDSRLSDWFIGTTPVLPVAKNEYRGRERECLQWLAESGFTDGQWLAIDDVAGNFSYGSPRLVLTDYRVGLMPQDVEHVLSKLPCS